VQARSVELLGLTFVVVQDPAVASLIEGKVDAFVRDSGASGGRVGFPTLASLLLMHLRR
jgi:hypothetical protein